MEDEPAEEAVAPRRPGDRRAQPRDRGHPQLHPRAAADDAAARRTRSRRSPGSPRSSGCTRSSTSRSTSTAVRRSCDPCRADRRSDILFIAREALRNVARHSGATRDRAGPRRRRRHAWSSPSRTTGAASTPPRSGPGRGRPAPGPDQHARPGDRPGRAVQPRTARRRRHAYHRQRPRVTRGRHSRAPRRRHRRKLDRDRPRTPSPASARGRRPRGRPPGPRRAARPPRRVPGRRRGRHRRRGDRAARRFQPDLVVMDVRLPDGSGIEACREIRAELPDHARRDAHELPRRGGGAVRDRRRRQRLPAQADPGARPRRGARGRRPRRVAARPGGHREGPRARPPDRDRRVQRTSWPR